MLWNSDKKCNGIIARLTMVDAPVPGKRQRVRQISQCKISCKRDTERVESKAEDELDRTKWKRDTT